MVTELVEGPMGRNNLRKVLDSTELRPMLSWSLREPPFFPLPVFSLSQAAQLPRLDLAGAMRRSR